MKGRYTAGPADPQRSKPDDRHMAQLLNELEEAVESLAYGVPLHPGAGDPKLRAERGMAAVELVRRARAGTKDGYPTSSIGGGGGAATVTDDEGMPMPAVSDRTGELAADRADGRVHDEVHEAARTMFRELNAARRALNRAVDALVRATPKAPTPTEPGCRSCERIGVWAPIYRGDDANETGRCRWCYDWWLVHKDEPPAELLRIYLERGRVTTGDIRKWQAAQVNTRRHRRRRRA